MPASRGEKRPLMDNKSKTDASKPTSYQAGDTGLSAPPASDEKQIEKSVFAQHLSMNRTLDFNVWMDNLSLWKKNCRGYLGIFFFLFFVCTFCTMMSLQRQPQVSSAQARAMRTGMQRSSIVGKKFWNEITFWKWIGSQLGTWMSDPWEHVTADGVKMSGYQPQKTNNMLAGISVFTKRRAPGVCHGDAQFYQPQSYAAKSGKAVCYSHDKISTDTLRLKSTKFKTEIDLPFAYGGYTAFIPSTMTLPQAQQVMAFYEDANFIDASTSEVSVRFMAYNGNLGTFALVDLRATINLAGLYGHDYHVDSVRFKLYEDGSSGHTQFIVEIFFVCFFAFMVWNLFLSYVNHTPLLPHCLENYRPNHLLAKGWCLLHPQFVPHAEARGMPYVFLPCILYITIIVCGIQWCMLSDRYKEMHALLGDEDSNKHIYTTFTGTDVFATQQTATGPQFVWAPDLINFFNPVWDSLVAIKWKFQLYCFTGCLTILLSIAHMFNYFDFQPRLNTINETFRKAYVDLAHLFFVLTLAVFGYAFVGYLVFGPEMKGWEHFGSAVLNVFEMIFTVYKFQMWQQHYQSVQLSNMYALMFKVVVLLLLLKMLVGIIFMTYRQVTQQNHKKLLHTVNEDLFKYLLRDFLDYVRSWWSVGYISPTHLNAFIRHEAVHNYFNSLGMTEEGDRIIDDAEKLLDLLKQANINNICKSYGTNMKVTMAHAEWVMLRHGKLRKKKQTDSLVLSAKNMLELLHTFKKFDHDNSGAIDTVELRMALLEFGHPKAKDQRFLKEVMLRVDADGTGMIEFAEFAKFVAEESGFDEPQHDFLDEANLLRIVAEEAEAAKPADELRSSSRGSGTTIELKSSKKR